MLFLKLIFLCPLFFCACGLIPHTLLSDLDFSSSSAPADVLRDTLDEKWEYEESRRLKEVDILFIVDTSYAMIKHLNKVDHTFKNFLPALSPAYWKMTFTNADYDTKGFSYYNRDLFNGKAMFLELSGALLPYKFLYSYVSEGEDIFLDTLKRYQPGDVSRYSDQYINPCDLPPYCQGSSRNPISSLVNSFSANKDLFRRHAPFVAIIFTNGDDESWNYEKVFDEFQKQHGSAKEMKVYSIAIIPDDKTCLDKDESAHYSFAHSAYGRNIHKLVKTTGGKTMSICAEDYSPLAKAIVREL